jgi:uncharacterized protein (DUF2267 family)
MKTAWVVSFAALLAPAVASAMPLAASVASPPLVVGGLLVGLVLLGAAVTLLLRTFRNIQSVTETDPADEARTEVQALQSAWESKPSVEILRDLVAGLRESVTGDEAETFAAALSDATGRYFGRDDVSWEVWVRREGDAHVRQLLSSEEQLRPASEYLPVS